jgi:hypothetical protein
VLTSVWIQTFHYTECTLPHTNQNRHWWYICSSLHFTFRTPYQCVVKPGAGNNYNERYCFFTNNIVHSSHSHTTLKHWILLTLLQGSLGVRSIVARLLHTTTTTTTTSSSFFFLHHLLFLLLLRSASLGYSSPFLSLTMYFVPPTSRSLPSSPARWFVFLGHVVVV